MGQASTYISAVSKFGARAAKSQQIPGRKVPSRGAPKKAPKHPLSATPHSQHCTHAPKTKPSPRTRAQVALVICAQERRGNLKGLAVAAARGGESTQNSICHFFARKGRTASKEKYTSGSRQGQQVRHTKKRGL
jgi:hypothetical protein